MRGVASGATILLLWHNDHPGGWTLGEAGEVKLTARQQKHLDAIRAELSSLDLCLPGTMTVRTGVCGKSACVCRGRPPRLHGPFRSWTRKVAGKTVTRYLSEEQLHDYQRFFDDHRRLKELVHELEELSLSIVESDPRWKR